MTRIFPYKDRTVFKNCSYSKFFWSVFSRIRTEYGPEKLRIRTHFSQWNLQFRENLYSNIFYAVIMENERVSKKAN